jgi:hypothetical protein
MKIERFDYLYMLFGVLCGFLLGSSVGQESAGVVRRMLFASAIFFVAFYWRKIESKAHSQHLQQWDELEERGKWRFIVTRYLLARGAVLSVLLYGPALSTIRFSGVVLAILAFSGSLLIAILLWLGHEEWNDCDQEMQILALRQTGEFITSTQN